MHDDDGAEDGVGALNARSEILIFTRPLPARPDRYQCVAPDLVRLLARGRVIHSARYGDLVYGGAASRRPVMVSEVAEGGAVSRVSRAAMVGGPR